MKEIDHSASNVTIGNFLKAERSITLGQALNTLHENMYIEQVYVDEIQEAMDKILQTLNVVFDPETEQWVTADEGHPV